MIDGFGWFEPSDYLRSWLFFDDVEYVLADAKDGPLAYPPWVFDRPDYKAIHSEFDSSELTRIIQSAAMDAGNPEFRNFVESNVPVKDREYASALVQSDASLRGVVSQEQIHDSIFCLFLLVNKLLAHAALKDAVPIVGRAYASQLLAMKIQKWDENRLQGISPKPHDPQRAESYSAFATGLSFDFLSTDDLLAVPN
jgi:hypothetical protein